MKTLKSYLVAESILWNCKYISREKMLEKMNTALAVCKFKAEEVMREVPLAVCEDPDDAWNYYGSGKCRKYIKFENAVIDIIRDRAHEDELRQCIFDESYDLLKELR